MSCHHSVHTNTHHTVTLGLDIHTHTHKYTSHCYTWTGHPHTHTNTHRLLLSKRLKMTQTRLFCLVKLSLTPKTCNVTLARRLLVCKLPCSDIIQMWTDVQGNGKIILHSGVYHIVRRPKVTLKRIIFPKVLTLLLCNKHLKNH